MPLAWKMVSADDKDDDIVDRKMVITRQNYFILFVKVKRM